MIDNERFEEACYNCDSPAGFSLEDETNRMKVTNGISVLGRTYLCMHNCKDIIFSFGLGFGVISMTQTEKLLCRSQYYALLLNKKKCESRATIQNAGYKL